MKLQKKSLGIASILLIICFVASTMTVFGETYKNKIDTSDPTFAKLTSFQYLDTNNVYHQLGANFLTMPMQSGETLYEAGYRIMQAGCTSPDGNYLYYIIINKRPDKTDYNKSALLRVTLANNRVEILKTGMSLGHANDMAYYDGKLFIAHYRNSSDTLVKTISIINLSTLADPVVIPNSRVNLSDSAVGISGIAYNSTQDQFVFLITDNTRGIYRFAKMEYNPTTVSFQEQSGGFSITKDSDVSSLVIDSGHNYNFQGIDCSAGKIYMLLSPYIPDDTTDKQQLAETLLNRIVIYRWSDNVHLYTTILGSSCEGENISHINGSYQFYVGYNAAAYLGLPEAQTRVHTFELLTP